MVSSSDRVYMLRARRKLLIILFLISGVLVTIETLFKRPVNRFFALLESRGRPTKVPSYKASETSLNDWSISGSDQLSTMGEDLLNISDPLNYDNTLNEEFYDDNGRELVSVFRNNLFKFSCTNVRSRRALKRNKDLIVFKNFIIGSHEMLCHQSITLTSHADYRYLDNLIPLMARWNGPISVAVYASGGDLRYTLKIISFLRDCASKAIEQLVTFHVFFDLAFSKVPGMNFQWLDSLYERERWKNCSKSPPSWIKRIKTFRMQRKLLYPVNVARNVARSSAQTHYVLPSDIELYPSTNLIPWFFEMLKLKQDHFSTTAREVYVLPIFEIERGFHPPTNKSEIIQLLHKGDAIPFHYHICKECHIIPNYEQWLQLPVGTSLQVFHKAKRKAPFNHWEPIYIGTKNDPPFDERLTWEGLRDKMTQGYIMCALDYDFLVLDNAFLIHRPGIKRVPRKPTKTIDWQNRLIDQRIKSELFRRFGHREGCVL